MLSLNKIKINDMCPCGSGKEYKNCCLHRPDDPKYFDWNSKGNFNEYKTEIRRMSYVKECIASELENCSSKIIRAHTFQKNGIIDKISENGKVIMPIPKDRSINNFADLYGVKEATTFTGFCSKHDKELFSAIEDEDFKKTNKQIFLFTYKCFAFHYHLKLKTFKAVQNMFKLRPSLIEEEWFIEYYKERNYSILDFKRDKNLFDKALITENYESIYSIVWEFNDEIKFAFSAFDAPISDFNNNVIQDYFTSPMLAKHIYFTVFPSNNKSYCIISFFDNDFDTFSSLYESFNKFSNKKRQNFINSIAIDLTENLIIKPSLWKSLPQSNKDEIARRFHEIGCEDPVYGYSQNRLIDPGYNLFS